MSYKLREDDILYININQYYIEKYLHKTYYPIRERDKDNEEITEYECNICNCYCRQCKICYQFICIECDDKEFCNKPYDTYEDVCSYCAKFPIRLFLSSDITSIIYEYSRDCERFNCSNILCEYCKLDIKNLEIFSYESNVYETCIYCKNKTNNISFITIYDGVDEKKYAYSCNDCYDKIIDKLKLLSETEFDIEDIECSEDE